MYDREYFLTTSLSYQLQAAHRELADFRSGEIYRKMRADYGEIIREQNFTIKKLRKERDDFSFSRKEITRQWMDVLEEAQGLILKLTAQVNHNYEIPPCPHHPRKPMEPDQVVEIAVEEKCKDGSRYIPTGNIISRQVIGISVVPAVTEYRTAEFYDKKKGRHVHSAFPCGAADDVNYDESMKVVLFLLNSRCNVSLEKTAQFVCDVTAGALSPSVGMINGLCREYAVTAWRPCILQGKTKGMPGSGIRLWKISAGFWSMTMRHAFTVMVPIIRSAWYT